MSPDPVPDIHLARTAALLAVFGPERLAALFVRFGQDLAELVAATQAGGDYPMLSGWAHRLQGSASTLGIDSTAAALAGFLDLIAAEPEAEPRAELICALQKAQACLARGRNTLAASRAGFADAHDFEASKR